MRTPDDVPSAAPDWVLTYGDLMSLLLTIFVMLVSMGELKRTDKFQGVADSLHEQFGSDRSLGMRPGGLRPRNPALAAVASALRIKRNAAMAGLPAGTDRVGDAKPPGVTIVFDDSAAGLSAESRAGLQRLAAVLSGEQRTIEVRGYLSVPDGTAVESPDDWNRALRAARASANYLTAEMGVDPARIRLSVSQEPADSAAADLRPHATGLRVDLLPQAVRP